MTRHYFPFDSGIGADSYEDRWTQMGAAWRNDGILADLEYGNLAVTANGTAMAVTLGPGAAWLHGHLYYSDASESLTISANNSGNPRIDRVILRLSTSTNIIAPTVLIGTAAATPSPPALTRALPTWEIELAQVRVENGAGAISADKVTLPATIYSGNTVQLHNLPAVPVARVYHNADQSIPNGVFTAVAFNSEYENTVGMHDNAVNNGWLTVPRAGLYEVTAGMSWHTNSTGMRVLSLVQNSTTIAQDRRIAYLYTTINLTTTTRCAVGDILAVSVFQDSGAALSILATGGSPTKFSAVWLGN